MKKKTHVKTRSFYHQCCSFVHYYVMHFDVFEINKYLVVVYKQAKSKKVQCNLDLVTLLISAKTAPKNRSF